MTLALAEPRTACATWYTVRGSNDVYWRAEVPAKAIGARTCFIPYETGTHELSYPGLRDRSFRWVATEDGAAYPDHEGAAVFTRPDQARATHALAMKADGHRIVAEVDDNYLAPVNQNLGMRLRYDSRSRELFRNALACFDALITTTPALRDMYAWVLRKEFPKTLRPRLEFHVCDNNVDPDDWPEPAPPGDRLRIGWMGSDSHFRDLKLAYPALKWAADQGHEVVLIGYDPKWSPQCAVQGHVGLKRGDEFGFPHTLVPWVDPREFDRPRVAWPLDIALAPLENTRFNLGKSDCKILEYAMSGCAVVASNMPVYSRTLRHGETGFLAGSREELLHWTRELCGNARLRADVAGGLVEYVKAERLIGPHAETWREAVCG